MTRGVGVDARTRPVALTTAAGALAAAIVGPWGQPQRQQPDALETVESQLGGEFAPLDGLVQQRGYL